MRLHVATTSAPCAGVMAARRTVAAHGVRVGGRPSAPAPPPVEFDAAGSQAVASAVADMGVKDAGAEGRKKISMVSLGCPKNTVMAATAGPRAARRRRPMRARSDACILRAWLTLHACQRPVFAARARGGAVHAHRRPPPASRSTGRSCWATWCVRASTLPTTRIRRRCWWSTRVRLWRTRRTSPSTPSWPQQSSRRHPRRGSSC